ncbi:MAG TPA: hypothetical protein VEU47_13425 [Candidatus Cybelea sp.]|nr:hypothetical protein [Candidatus Cybelea sp.]
MSKMIKNLLATAAIAGLLVSPALAANLELDGNLVVGGTLTAPGHVITGATPPVLTSCGTSPTIVGSDTDGLITMGTTATGCIITFASPYVSAPFCVVTWQATPLASQSYTVTNTAITTVQTSTSNNKLNYHCVAQSGG